MGVERRKYVRFLAQDNTFAALRIGFKKVGKIDDISINGLAFSYLSETVGAGSDRHLTGYNYGKQCSMDTSYTN